MRSIHLVGEFVDAGPLHGVFNLTMVFIAQLSGMMRIILDNMSDAVFGTLLERHGSSLEPEGRYTSVHYGGPVVAFRTDICHSICEVSHFAPASRRQGTRNFSQQW